MAEDNTIVILDKVFEADGDFHYDFSIDDLNKINTFLTNKKLQYIGITIKSLTSDWTGNRLFICSKSVMCGQNLAYISSICFNINTYNDHLYILDLRNNPTNSGTWRLVRKR